MGANLVFDPQCTCTADDPNGNDPDIAGPGVLIGFLLTGALTFGVSSIILWLQYISSHNRKPPALLRRLTPKNAAADPVSFWETALTEVCWFCSYFHFLADDCQFVVELSDQQLLLGLLLIICAYIQYWPSAIVFGTDNLWTAGDIVCFSIFTHAATLLSLRSHFRHHRKLATARIIVMFVVYGLWFIVAMMELAPYKPKNSTKKASTLSQFWHAAIVIEALSIMWIYLIVYVPLFLSEEGTVVRSIISERDETRFESIRIWIMQHKRRRSSGFSNRMGWRSYNPYALARSKLTDLAVKFAHLYVQPMSATRRWFLWLSAELLFPWQIASYVITLTWVFSLAALIVSLVQSGLATDSWKFGQLLPAVLVLLPFSSLATAIAGKFTITFA